MSYQPPQQQQRYADSGRRQITILNRQVLATLGRLKEADARVLGVSHEIFTDRIPGISNPALVGQVIDFDGTLYRVVKVTDPRAADPTMRGRYLRLLCNVAPH